MVSNRFPAEKLSHLLIFRYWVFDSINQQSPTPSFITTHAKKSYVSAASCANKSSKANQTAAIVRKLWTRKKKTVPRMTTPIHQSRQTPSIPPLKTAQRRIHQWKSLLLSKRKPTLPIYYCPKRTTTYSHGTNCHRSTRNSCPLLSEARTLCNMT